MLNIAIFEDKNCLSFYPLTLTKPVWELFCGTKTIAARLINGLNIPGKNYFFTREILSGMYKIKYPDMSINSTAPLQQGQTTLFINAAIADISLCSGLNIGEAILDTDGSIAAALIKLESGIELSAITEGIISNTKINIISKTNLLYKHLWDIVDANPQIIIEDAKTIERPHRETLFTVAGNPDDVISSATSRVEPGVVFNTIGGPVILGENCEIHAFSRIEGPAFIGANSVILGAKIRSGTSIGPGCRIGGEIEQSIFHSNSNKYHDGFIGHSYIGEWVNMGALTTNSDLKNNYSTVSTYTYESGINDTGRMKIGCFLGDFVKTSIGTLLSTGSVAATGAMIVHAGYLTPPHIRPFEWYTGNALSRKEWKNKFLESAETMLSRRNKKLFPEYRLMLEQIYDESFLQQDQK